MTQRQPELCPLCHGKGDFRTGPGPHDEPPEVRFCYRCHGQGWVKDGYPSFGPNRLARSPAP